MRDCEYPNLTQFLNQYRCKKIDGQYTKPPTHTSLAKGSFNIPDSELDNFIDLYIREIKNKNPVHLTETNVEVSPIKIDIDLKFDASKYNDRVYDSELVKNFVMICNKWLKTIFNGPDENFYAFVFERKEPYVYKNKTLKDGFHIMYPYIACNTAYQHILRKELLLNTKELFSSLNCLNPLSDIIDESIISRNNWMMYGSSKPSLEPYLLTKIIDLKGSYLSLFDYKDPYELIKLFSIRNKTPSNMHEDEKKKLDELCSEMKEKKAQKKIKLMINKPEIHRILNADQRKLIKKLVSILSPIRCDKYESWMNVGWCLFNISPELFEVWNEFSMKSSKYDHNECMDIWRNMKMKEDGFTLGSLKAWAKEDNKEEYEEIIKQSKTEAVFKYLEKPDDASIATALKIYYKDEFVCTEENGKMWYYFKNHMWYKSPRGLTLRSKLSHEFSNLYYNRLNQLTREKCEASEEEQDKYAERIDKLGKIARGFSSNTTKTRIMNESIENFYDEDFIERLDNNPNLIGFDNGIYDLENDVFRSGKPDDYVSLSTGYDFHPYSIEEPDEKMTELLIFLQQIMYDSNIYNYILTFLGSTLAGKNPDELFHIFTGSGSNGKSKMMDLMKYSLGKYYSTINTTLLTKARPSSNQASPDVLGLKGKRLIVASEPEKNDKITAGFMKLLSGGDDVKARNLYSSHEIEFKPFFKMVMLCNDLPRIDSHDDGTWRRIRVGPFKSRFVDKPRKLNEYPIDRTLSDKLKDWRERMMAILLYYHRQYKTVGLKIVKEVVEETEKYKQDTNAFAQFAKEKLCTLDPPRKRGHLPINVIYNDHFKHWYQQIYDKKIPSRTEMSNELQKLNGFGKCDYRGWKNIGLKEEMEFESDDEE